MTYEAPVYPENKAERYALLLAQAQGLTEGIRNPVTNLANVAALLYQGLNDLNWCGFYMREGNMLMLAPFCGLPACTLIPFGRGVCGTAAAQDAVQRVADVHAFPGHIACDGASNSEIVIPLHWEGKVIGVLDIDSPKLSRFDEQDEAGLLSIVQMLETVCDFDWKGYGC